MGTADGYLSDPLYREVASLLTQAGIPHEVEIGSKHWHLVYQVGPKVHMQVLSRGSKAKMFTVKRTQAKFRKLLDARKRGDASVVIEGEEFVFAEQAQPELDLDTAPKPAGNAISIAGHRLERIEWQGQPVVTLAQVDEVHERALGTARRTFNDHRARFVEGEDYVTEKLDVLRSAFPGAFPVRGGGDVTLITKRGYLKLTKPMQDDRSWAVFNEMADRYFLVEQIRREAAALPAPAGLAADDFKSLCQAFSRISNARSREQADRVVAALEQTALAIRDRDRHLYRALEGHFQKPVSAVVLQSAAFVEVGGVYAIAGVTGAVPRRASLSSNITNSLDAWCRKHGVAARSALIGTREVTHWPRETVLEWLAAKGKDLIARHLAVGAGQTVLTLVPTHNHS